MAAAHLQLIGWRHAMAWSNSLVKLNIANFLGSKTLSAINTQRFYFLVTTFCGLLVPLWMQTSRYCEIIRYIIKTCKALSMNNSYPLTCWSSMLFHWILHTVCSFKTELFCTFLAFSQKLTARNIYRSSSTEGSSDFLVLFLY